MMIAVKAISAFAATMMMAAGPISGECRERVMLLCSGDGESHRIILWDDEAPLPLPTVGKACHACTFDKKRIGRKSRARS